MRLDNRLGNRQPQPAFTAVLLARFFELSEKRSKIFTSLSSGMPEPVSLTAICTPSGCRRATSVTVPPSGV